MLKLWNKEIISVKKNFHKENIHENSTKGKITKKIEQIIIERN